MLYCDQIIISKLVMMHLLLPFSLTMDTELYLNPAFPIHMPGKKFVHWSRMDLSSPFTPKNSIADTPRVYWYVSTQDQFFLCTELVLPGSKQESITFLHSQVKATSSSEPPRDEELLRNFCRLQHGHVVLEYQSPAEGRVPWAAHCAWLSAYQAALSHLLSCLTSALHSAAV